MLLEAAAKPDSPGTALLCSDMLNISLPLDWAMPGKYRLCGATLIEARTCRAKPCRATLCGSMLRRAMCGAMLHRAALCRAISVLNEVVLSKVTSHEAALKVLVSVLLPSWLSWIVLHMCTCMQLEYA